ncbi:MAG: tetratricopeptide repeat protein [Myxococcota bacterium]
MEAGTQPGQPEWNQTQRIEALEREGRFPELATELAAAAARAEGTERAAILARLGEVRLRLDDIARALETFAASLELDPTQQASRRWLEVLLAEPAHALSAAELLEPVYEREFRKISHSAVMLLAILELRANRCADQDERIAIWVQFGAVFDVAAVPADRARDIAVRLLVRMAVEWPGGVAKWIERLVRLTPDPTQRLEGLVSALNQPLSDGTAIAVLSLAAGDALAQLGRVTEARGLYERALASDPTSPELLTRLDLMAASNDAPEVRAKRYFDAIARTDEPDRRAALRVALGLLQHGALRATEAALDTLRQAVSEAPTLLRAHQALVTVLHALGDDEALLAEFERARGVFEGSERRAIEERMAEVLLGLNRGQDALALVAPIVDQAQVDNGTLDLVERVAEDVSDLPTLRKVYEHRVQNASDGFARVRALEAFGELLLDRLNEPVAAAATWKSAAELLAENEDESSEPERLYERALQATPNDVAAARRLIELCARGADWTKVPGACRALLAAAQDALVAVPVVLSLEARAAQSGGADEFANMVDEVVSRLEDNREAETREMVSAKARVMASAGRFDEAARVYEALIESFADEPDVRAYIGLVESSPDAEWRHTKRSWLFEWRVANAEDPIAVLTHWAAVEEQEFSDIPAAIALLERATQHDARRADVWRELSRLRIASGDLAAGLAALTRVRELATNGDATEVELAMAELLIERLDQPQDALPLVEAALAAHPENPRLRELTLSLCRVPSTRAKASELLERASAAIDSPENQRATLRLLLDSSEEAAREGAPELSPLRRRWFERLVALESGDAALAVFERAAAEFPTESGIWDAVEQGAIRAKHPEGALRAYTGALARAEDPKLAEELGKRLVAFSEEHVGNPGALTAPLERLLMVAPSARWAFERVKIGLTREQRWESLFPLYERVIDATPDEAERAALLDEAAIAARDLATDPERAIAYWESYFALRSNDARVDLALERLYERQQKLDRLIAHLTRREPNLEGDELVRARERVTDLWLQLGDGRSALAVLEGQPKSVAAAESTLALLERVFRLPLPEAPEARETQQKVAKRAAKLLKQRYTAAGRPRDVANVVVVELTGELGNKERIQLLRTLAELRQTLNDGEGEFECLGELMLLEPDDESHRVRMNELSQQLGNRARFAALIVEAAERVAGKPLFALLISEAAAIELELGQRERGIELFARILNEAEEPATRLGAAGRLERLLLEAGRAGERCSVLERMAELSKDPAERRDVLLEASRVALDELSEPLRAAQDYRLLLEAEPRDRSLIDGLLKALRVGERWEEVIVALEQRAALEPDSPRARRDRGEAARLRAEKLGDVEGAIEAWKSVRQSFGRDAESFELLSQHFEALGRYAELAELLAEEASGSPAPAPLYARLAQVHRLHTGDLPASLAAYMRAADLVSASELFCGHDELVPDDPSLALELSERLAQANNADLAELVLRRQIQHYGPRRPREGARVHLALASLLTTLGRSPQALEELSSAAQRYPESSRILSALGNLALKLSDLERAEHSFRSLLMVLGRARDEGGPAPSRGEVYLYLSQVASLRGDTEKSNDHVASAFEAALASEEEALALEAALKRQGRNDLLERAVSARLERAREPGKVASALHDLLELNSAFGVIEPALAERALKLAERAARDLESAGGAQTQAWQTLLDVFEKLGEKERVLGVLEALAARAASDVERGEYDLLIARQLLDLPTRRDEAVRKLWDLIKRDPARSEPYELLTGLINDSEKLDELVELTREQLAAAEADGDRQTLEVLAVRLAATFEKLGRLREALEVQGRLAKLPERRAEALQRSVELHERIGTSGPEYADAIEALLGIETSPERAAPLALKLAELRRADADSAAVERALNRGFVLAPGDSSISNALVAELIARGSHLRAVEVLERALEHSGRDASLHLRLAEALQKSGDSERALLALDAAAAAGANDAAVRRERAGILEGLGRADEALSELEAALQSEGGSSEELLAAIERTRVFETSERWALRASDISAEAGQRQRARALIEPWLNRHADSVPLLSRLAKLATAERDFDAAIEAYKKLCKLEQGTARRTAALGLARVAESAGRPEVAVAEVESALADGLDSVELRRELGRLYARTGDRLKQARMLLEEARSAKASAQADLFAKAADLFAAEHASDEALAALGELKKLDPERIETQLLTANVLAAAGRHSEAHAGLAQFLAATEKRHTKLHAKLYLRLAELSLAQDAWVEAMEPLSRGHQLDKGDPEIAFTLGLLAADLDEVDTALAALRVFVTLKDKATDMPTRRQLSRACLQLAELELGKGQKTVARRMATRATEADPQNKDAQRLLSELGGR